MKYSFQKSFMPLLTFLTLVINAVGVTPAYAATLTVTSLADSGTGSLRDTIAGATAGDTITFADGLSGQTIRLSSTLVINKNLTIDGSSLAEQVIISGDTDSDNTGEVRVFIVNAGVTALLKNLTITKGMGDTLVQDPTFLAEGGGIFNAGTLTVTNSTLSDNTVTYPDPDTQAGGAISNHGTLTVTNTTFTGNHSTWLGGAMYNFTGAAMTVANSTFSGNIADYTGGGIFNRGTLQLINSTLSGNVGGSPTDGAGVLNFGTGVLNYANTIIGNSTNGLDCYNYLGTIGTNTNNLVENGGCSASLSGDPNLGSLADNGGPNQTFALLAGSAALGTGNAATCAASPVSNLDQRGRVRPQGETNCDIGAYESSTGPAAPAVTAPVGLTNDATPAISGTAEPYSSVDVFQGLVPLCSDVPVNGLGNWACVSPALTDGTIQLTVNTTAAGAGGTSANTAHSFTVDTTAPTVSSIVRADADNTGAASVNFTVTFSEPVTGVDANDFSLHVTGNVTGATISGVTGTGATYTVTVNTGTESGSLRLDVLASATITDLATNALSGTLPFEAGETYTIVKTQVPTQGMDTTGVFRPINGIIFLKHSHSSGFADVGLNYGIPGDYPVVGDWDGNGTVTIGVYRNGQFFLRNENTIGFAELVFAFGQPGDQPVAGDWDGDGIDTIGVYRPSNGQFMLRNSNDAGAADISFFLGNVGDVGIAGDWDGDGKDTTGVFRPINGIIFLKNANDTGFADVGLNYGIPGDKPVIGDWDGDGDDTIGVYRNGRFFLRNSNDIGFADIVFDLGNPGDMPIAGNWDGSIP